MKKFFAFLSSLVLAVTVLTANPGEIEEKFIRSFESSFPNAEKVKWQDLPDTYVVSFYENDLPARVFYRKDGFSIQLVRYYKSDGLPFYISQRIKKEYPGKKVFGVVEVSTLLAFEKTSTLFYHITLEDNRIWYTVKADNNGNLITVKKVRKSD